MVSVGMTNQEISQQLQRSIHTINTHIKNIFQK
ncbi:helix-turn-helix transcriptional regulator, partial [Escherichia coli]|nr:helix-turn-helix transcriptional regulator [Escherichia coli]